MGMFYKNNISGGGGLISADNGIYNDLGTVKLGGGLIQDTSINSNGFTFDIGYSNGDSGQLLIDPNGIFLGDPYSLFSLNDRGLFLSYDSLTGNSVTVLSNSSNYTTGNVITGLAWTGPMALRPRSFGFDNYGNIIANYHGTTSDLTNFFVDIASGEIITGDSNSAFLFRNVASTAGLTLDINNYVDISINGTSYKLALVN